MTVWTSMNAEGHVIDAVTAIDLLARYTPSGESTFGNLISREIESCKEHYYLPVTRKNTLRYSKEEQFAYAFGYMDGFLAKASALLPADTADLLSRRLHDFGAFENWELEESPPDLRSFVIMFKFLAEHPDLTPPTIFITADGLFELAWRPTMEKLVSFRFHNDGTVGYLVFMPAEDDPEMVEEAAGNTFRPLERIKPMGALRWVCRD